MPKTGLVQNDDNRIHRIKQNVEPTESWLQRYLANYPELLPVRDLDGMSSKLCLIGRELIAMDLLFVDQRGLLTIVETKLFKNPQLRRNVVAQLLDYAARVRKLDVVELCKLIAELKGGKAIEGLQDLKKLTHMLSKYLSLEGSTKESTVRAKAVLAHYVIQGKIDSSVKLSATEQRFLERLDLMLREGSFRLVIVTDKASQELLDLVNYVTSTMQRGCQLVVFELSIQELDGSKYFIPHLVGAPGLLSAEYYREERGASQIRREWEKESFLEEIRKRLDEGKFTDEQHKAILKLLDFTEKSAEEVRWGTGSERGSFNPIYSNIGRSLYTVYSDGTLTLNFWLRKYPRVKQRYKQLLLQNRMFGFSPSFDGEHFNVPIGKWLDHREQFQNIITELLEK